jgi:hypothetical protein
MSYGHYAISDDYKLAVSNFLLSIIPRRLLEVVELDDIAHDPLRMH